MAFLYYILFFVSVSCSATQVSDDRGEHTSCVCVPYHKCIYSPDQVLLAPLFNPGTPSKDLYTENVINISNPGEQGKCKHYLDKCCFPNGTTTTPPIDQLKPIPPIDETGLRHPNGVGFRITGGKDNESNYGEFPWVVAVLRRDASRENVTAMECAGSIIHPLVVLTTAHCVKGKSYLYIRAGEWDTQTEKEFFPTQNREVKEVIIHENYDYRQLNNDIALLVLERALEMNEVVGPLRLPQQNENMDGRDCIVTGWGKTLFGKEGENQVILKRVHQSVIHHHTCQNMLRGTRLGQRFRLHESFLCAETTRENSCKGDGGGPLACPEKDDPRMYVQAGILDWSMGCESETPTVYVNVPHFTTWINDKLQSHKDLSS